MTKGKVLSQSPAARVLAGLGRVGVLGYSGEVGRADADASGKHGEGGSLGHSLAPLGDKEPRAPRAGGNSAREESQPVFKF